MYFFGNSITHKKQKQQRAVGDVEVLKKQEKVAVEEISKTYDMKKSTMIDSIDAQIVNLTAQIKTLEKTKQDKEDMFDEEKKVAIDKCINDYTAKIIKKQNYIRKLGNYIDAEHKNIQDVLQSDTNNTAVFSQANNNNVPKILNEQQSIPKTKKTSK